MNLDEIILLPLGFAKAWAMGTRRLALTCLIVALSFPSTLCRHVDSPKTLDDGGDTQSHETADTHDTADSEKDILRRKKSDVHDIHQKLLQVKLKVRC